MKTWMTIASSCALAAMLSQPPNNLAQAQDPLIGRQVVDPHPTGANQVGTVSVRLVDSARNDPYRSHSGKRELMVRFWYPASSVEVCQPADYSSPKVWNYLSHISGFRLPNVKTHSCVGAAVAAGVHPVIVFTHGYTGMLTDSTFIFEDLASRGYVVTSIAHTNETTAVEFPNARLVTSLFGSYLAQATLRMDYRTLRLAHAVRLADVRFVLNVLQRLNSTSTDLFAGRLDLSRIGIMGHSLGGEVALASLEHETRLRAAVSLDGALSPEETAGTGKPVLLLAAGHEHWSHEECQLWNGFRGPRLAINLKGADHFTPSDAIWLFQSVPAMAASVGGMGRVRTIAALRNFIASFFNTYLLNESQDPLLSGSSSAFPDAIVTTQSQELCQGNIATAKGALQ